MSGRNRERIGVDPTELQEADPVVQQVKNTGTELSYTQPTEMIELPTRGKFYPVGHPLHKVEAVEIRYMTAKDEEILNSRTLLQKGVALDKMIQGLLTDKSIKVDDMFLGDKNALVLAARITGYGSDYKTGVTCTSCGEKTSHQFDLNKVRIKESPEDVVLDEEGMFKLKLPKSGAEVTLRMLTGRDEKAMKLGADKKKKHNLPESPITDNLKQIIVSVNNDSDEGVITKFVDSMLAIDSRHIREEYARLFPNVDLKQDFECSSCNSQAEITIPFTADFFWPGR